MTGLAQLDCHEPVSSKGDFFAFPLSSAQKRMWRSVRDQPENTAYNASFRWRLAGPLDPSILERTFNEILRRHEALRAAFLEDGGVPVQIIVPSCQLHIPVVDLRPLGAPDRDATMERLCEEEARRGFDIREAPLVRVSLLRMEDERHVLLLTLHHLVCDGWSIGLIMEELQGIYPAFSAGSEVSPLPELGLQYPDYAIWQRESSGAEETTRQLTYWQRKLAGSRRTEVPTDFARTDGPGNGAILSSLLPRELTDALKEIGNRQGGTLFVITLAACMMLLHRLTGECDLSVGSPLAGRNRSELEGLVGLFVNHVVFRADAKGDPLFPDFVRRVRDTVWEAFANQDVPFDDVAKGLREGGHADDPLFAVNFICQREYARASSFVFDFAGIRMETMPSKCQGALYDLNFFLVEREAGWRLSLEYNIGLYRQETAERMLQNFRELLEAIAANPNRPLSEFPMSVSTLRAAEEEPTRQLDNPPGGRDVDVLPASLAQKRFWWLETITPGSPALIMPASVRLRGPLRDDVLEKSFQALVDRHEILRTNFEASGDDLNQIILPLRPFILNRTILDGGTDLEREAQLTQLIRDEAGSPFDLLSGPLMRAHLFRISAGEHVLTITTHHIATDGWSQGVLQRELWDLYEALRQDCESPLPPLLIQYADFAHWQKEWLESGAGDEDLAFWSKKLAGRLPVLDFPTDRPSQGATSSGAMETLLFPEELTVALKNYSQSRQATSFTTMLACYAALLFRYTHQPDLVLGAPAANRKPETEPLIGPFAGPVCLRLDVSGDPTLSELLDRVRNVVLDALSHTDLPFEKLLEILDTRSVDGRSPLFQFYFFQQTAFLQPRQLSDLVVTPLPTLSLGTPFEMQLGLVERQEGIRAQLEYNAGLFNPGTIQEFLSLYQSIARAMVGSPELRLSQLPTPQFARPSGSSRAGIPERAYIAPLNDREIRLARIWADLLSAGRIGREDNFFELGGNSFLATRAVSRIRDEFQTDLSLRVFFSNPTLAAQAAVVADGTGAPTPVVRIPRRTGAGPFPLSFAQQRLWLADRLAPGNAVYNIPEVIPFQGFLDTAILNRALNALIDRHETLRTAFVERSGEAEQVISPSLQLEIAQVELKEPEGGERRGGWMALAREEARKPFDLSRAPLMRATLFKVSQQEHVLLLVLHHIVTDEWSMGLLRRELLTLYQSFIDSQPSPLSELPVQYADYSCWQRGRLSGETLEAEISYWKEELEGAPPVLELPTDKLRPPVQTFQGSVEPLDLPLALLENLRALGRQEGATLFMVLLAGFMAVLHRYTGQNDLLVGSPISGRTSTDVEGLIGFFVNTLVLRGKFPAGMSFRSLLRQVRETAIGAYAHQDLPFEKLVAELVRERQPSHSPLFQVMFVLHNAVTSGNIAEPQLTYATELNTGTSKFDLTLAMNESAAGLSGIFEYNTALFERDTILRMGGHLRTLLESALDNPEQLVADLPLLTEEESRILGDWSHPRPDESSGNSPIRSQCVHRLIEAQAESTPLAKAVEFQGTSFTYKQLNDRANQLASYLQRHSVLPGTLVGLCLDRSPEMLIAVIAVLKAGAAYVPLDPAYPRQRLLDVIEDASIRVLITEPSHADSVGGGVETVLSLDLIQRDVANEPAGNLDIESKAENLAYVIFTSGSAGRPKGVEITHGALANFLGSMRRMPGICANDVLLAVTTLSFDIAALELLLPLTAGASITLASRETASNGPELLKLLTPQVTIMQATPATWSMLFDAGWGGSPQLKILCGGEAISRDLANRLAESGREAWNMYGPTETTVWSAVCPLRRGQGPVPIGGPIANTSLYVLDDHRRLVPIGIPGELYIAGDGLARGYLGRPDLTEDRFVPDPFGPASGGRLYRTGDLVRYRPDGLIEFLGRRDNQVKVRGHRIELGEIESALRMQQGVLDAAVITVDRGPSDKHLAAFLIANGDNAPTAAETRVFLSRRLPAYMIPSFVTILDEFPRTPNGKLSREGLKALSLEPTETRDSIKAPRNGTERRLAAIWERVLNVRPIGITDDYFDIGGHSLLAVRLFSEIEKEFGAKLPLAILFEAPTIERLAKILSGELSRPTHSSLVGIQTLGAKPPLFLVSGLGGNVIRFRDLARHLGFDQPVYALQPPGLDGEGTFLTRIEDMAAQYIGEIRSIQPNGPYYIAGYSFGGLVTFEMVRQLSDQGHEIGLLALLDTPEWQYIRNHGKTRSGNSRIAVFKERFHRFILAPGGFGQLRDRLRQKAYPFLSRVFNALGKSVPKSLGALQDVNLVAASKYRPQRYAGTITLFRTGMSSDSGRHDYELGWGKLAGRVEVHGVPGQHDSMTSEPAVQFLAREIAACLEKHESGAVRSSTATEPQPS